MCPYCSGASSPTPFAGSLLDGRGGGRLHLDSDGAGAGARGRSRGRRHGPLQTRQEKRLAVTGEPRSGLFGDSWGPVKLPFKFFPTSGTIVTGEVN